MSDSNRIQVSYLRETTWGTTPSSAFTELLLTGGGFTHDLETVESQQVRSDAQSAGFKRTGTDASASLQVEWSAGAFDELLRGALRSDADWSTNPDLSATDVTVALVGSTYTTTGDIDFSTNITKGQWVYIAGFTETANNGWKRCTSVSSTVLTVAQSLANEASGDSVTFNSSQIVNGTTQSSYSLQAEYLDLTNRLNIITGARVGSWSMDVSPGAILTGEFEFSGKDIAQAAAKAGDGTVTAAAGNSVMSEVDAVNNIFIDDVATTADVTNFSLALNSNPRSNRALGNLANVAIGQGKTSVTGGLEMYLDDTSWAEQGNLFNFTKFQVAIDFDDGTNRYLVELPQCVYTSESGELPAVDSDKTLSFQFGCEPGGSFGSGSSTKTIQICKV